MTIQMKFEKETVNLNPEFAEQELPFETIKVTKEVAIKANEILDRFKDRLEIAQKYYNQIFTSDLSTKLFYSEKDYCAVLALSQGSNIMQHCGSSYVDFNHAVRLLSNEQ